MITHDSYLGRPAACLLIVLTGLFATRAGAVAIIEYPIPTANSYPYAMVSGPDGNLWFTEAHAGRLARITTAGQVTEFPVAAGAIAAGSDGNVWFTANAAIGRITPAGAVTLFPYGGSRPTGLGLGADGNLYLTENAGRILKITPQGVITDFSTSLAGSAPTAITQGPDGNLWYTAIGCSSCDPSMPDTIGRISPAGAVTDFPIPTHSAVPSAIVTGPDGNLWFTEAGCDACSPRFPGSKIGKITPGGVITEYSTPTPQSAPTGIARGSDGNLWFTENAVSQVASISVAGLITEYPVPPSNFAPYGIAAGSDGNIWYAASANNRIGKIVLVAAGTVATPALSTGALLALCACLIAVAFRTRSRRARASSD